MKSNSKAHPILPKYSKEKLIAGFKLFALVIWGVFSGGLSVAQASTTPFIINFQMLARYVGSPPPAYTGVGYGLGTGTYWNGVNCNAATNYNSGSCSNITSLADDGTTVTGIGFYEQGAFGYQAGATNRLLDNYLDSQKPNGSTNVTRASFYFTNLPSGSYNVVLYGIDGASAYNNTTFTITNGATGLTQYCNDSAGVGDTAFVKGANYVVFTNIVVTNGVLRGVYGPTSTASPKADGCFNGAQLQYLGSSATNFSGGSMKLLISVPNSISINASISGNKLNMNWPANYTGWQLWSNSVGLDSGAYWFPVPGTDATNYVSITIDPAQPHVYYRMRHP